MSDFPKRSKRNLNALIPIYRAERFRKIFWEVWEASCRILWEYAEYTARVRKYAEKHSIEDAVERAIEECIEEGILEEFLRKNRAEAKNMSIYEYNQEKHLRQEREASWAEGRETGIQEGRETGIQEGREAERRKTVLNLSKMGMGVEKIAQAVEASVEDVQSWLGGERMED